MTERKIVEKKMIFLSTISFSPYCFFFGRLPALPDGRHGGKAGFPVLDSAPCGPGQSAPPKPSSGPPA